MLRINPLSYFKLDPYCGWCSLENKCSLRGDCRDAAQDPLYWISYKSGRCTTITSVQPQELQRTTARTLSLVIDNLPTLAGQFVCVFQALGKTLVTNATRYFWLFTELNLKFVASPETSSEHQLGKTIQEFRLSCECFKPFFNNC